MMYLSIGPTIKSIRSKKNLTQKQVYGDLCSRRHYIRIESGESVPSVYLLCEISKKLSVPIDELIKEE